jgi:predicted SnoaL-like aldol condensation-catalyzing enzyme
MMITAFPKQTANEETVWKLEHSYWECVKAQNLQSYRELWHPDFVAWPSVNTKPVRVEHVTDWLADNATKAQHLISYSLKPADSQAIGNLVVVHYWITFSWGDKNNIAETSTFRIGHTWIKTDNKWQIISGMGYPETDAKK